MPHSAFVYHVHQELEEFFFFQAHIPFEAGVVQECFEYCLFVCFLNI